MGTASSCVSHNLATHGALFTHTVLNEPYENFIQDQSAVVAFAQFVKIGGWLDSLNLQMNKHYPAKSYQFQLRDEWIFKYFFIEPKLHDAVNAFIKAEEYRPTISPKSFRAASLESDTKSHDSFSSFGESYKIVPGTEDLTLRDSVSLLCNVLFPLYVCSPDYEQFKYWLANRSEEVTFRSYSNRTRPLDEDDCNPSVLNAASLDDFENEEIGAHRDSAHLGMLLLSSAAYFDQNDLVEYLSRKNIVRTMEKFLNKSPIGVCICNAHNVGETRLPVLYANGAYEKIVGCSNDAIIGTSFQFLQGEMTDQEEPLRLLKSAMFKELGEQVVMTCQRKNSVPFLGAVAIKPAFDSEDNCVYWISLVYDLEKKNATQTELKRMDDLLAIIPYLLQKDSGTSLGL
jgi:PAS domain-containing protein